MSNVAKTLKIDFVLPAKVIKRRKWFLASCPLLDVHSQGETKEKALDNLKEALKLFFITCYEKGTLVSVLKESGFRPADFKRFPFPKNYSTIHVDVPFYSQSNINATRCHV